MSKYTIEYEMGRYHVWNPQGHWIANFETFEEAEEFVADKSRVRAKGLLVFIMGPDCTRDGATSGKRKAVLIGPGIPEVFSPTADAPALHLQVEIAPSGLGPGYYAVAKQEWAERIAGIPRTYTFDPGPVVRVRAIPYIDGKPTSGMMGGHFVFSSDSRMPVYGPVPVFDRFEG